MAPLVRPLLPEDVAGVVAVCRASLWLGAPGGWWQAARVEHLLRTDPDGAWVAQDGGEVVGVAMALVRERLWGLSLLAVGEAVRERGVGRALMDAALGTADRADGAIVLSSEHPGAMRLYAASGFALRPCVSAAGAVRFRPPRPAAVRAPREEDEGWMEAVAREVRGAAYTRDLPVWEARGAVLSVVEQRGWMAGLDGRVLCLVAADDEAARWLLEAHLGGVAEAEVDFIPAGHDWAVRTCLAAGLALSPGGPYFTRGRLGTLAPYLPNGAFL